MNTRGIKIGFSQQSSFNIGFSQQSSLYMLPEKGP
jgi:hypothetical protein